MDKDCCRDFEVEPYRKEKEEIDLVVFPNFTVVADVILHHSNLAHEHTSRSR